MVSGPGRIRIADGHAGIYPGLSQPRCDVSAEKTGAAEDGDTPYAIVWGHGQESAPSAALAQSLSPDQTQLKHIHSCPFPSTILIDLRKQDRGVRAIASEDMDEQQYAPKRIGLT